MTIILEFCSCKTLPYGIKHGLNSYHSPTNGIILPRTLIHFETGEYFSSIKFMKYPCKWHMFNKYV